MKEQSKTHLITTIILASITVAITVVLVISIKFSTKRKRFNYPRSRNIEPKVIEDDQFIKPNAKLNAKFKMLKLGNGMKTLLISDPYAKYAHIQISMNYGSNYDTLPGFCHFGEHMILQGSEKYKSLYAPLAAFYGIKGSEASASTGTTIQSYYIRLPDNTYYEKAIDILIDAFRYPLYDPSLIKNEILAIHNEFNGKINNFAKFINIQKQLSSPKTSYNSFTTGNNQTLNIGDYELLSKRLKGYHIVLKDPKNLFCILYSNHTLDKLEEYSNNYLNYKMHKFSDDEIDIEDKENLEENIEKLKNIEIFDEKLYKHGFFFNSLKLDNVLYINYYIGSIDFKKLKFNIYDYYNFLLNSKSLYKILREKNYISIYSMKLDTNEFIDNNNYFYIEIPLSEKGLNEINEVILIINKYIDIMKEEGYKKEYFINFVKYINSKKILEFKKDNLLSDEPLPFLSLYNNYLLYNNDEILVSGKLTEDDYDENILKKYLNLIRFEKSFYHVNTKTNISEINSSSIFNNPKEIELRYYNNTFILGKIPDEYEKKINDQSIKIDNLKIRDINPYFSEVYNQKVIPCYKEDKNSCKEKNEFDFENEDHYSGIQLDENDKNYKTYYQIDKSSESQLVKSYISIKSSLTSNSDLDDLSKKYLSYIISNKFENNEIIIDTPLIFKFTTFSDNTEKIITEFIDLLLETPKKEDFDIIKASKPLDSNTIFEVYLYRKFIVALFKSSEEENKEKNINQNEIKMSSQSDNIEYNNFLDYHSKIYNNIKSIDFLIAGNIDKNLVQNIHNSIKRKIKINNRENIISNKVPLLNNNNEESTYVKNFYLKSIYDDPRNGIIVGYKVPEEYDIYFKIFASCLITPSFEYLRFNRTNTYTPNIIYASSRFQILETGVTKEVDVMEDDINNFLLDIIEGKIKSSNYERIRESYLVNQEIKIEKTFDTLFDQFINDTKGFPSSQPEENKNKLDIPKTFEELVEKVSPVLIKPKRTTVLVARKSISDDDFNKMVEKKKKNIQKYPLNKDISIENKILQE